MKPNDYMLHASDWRGEDPAGWSASIKHDGHFARFDGEHLWTRQGHELAAPASWLKGLPPIPLDAELFAGNGQRLTLNGATKWSSRDARWATCKLVVFDVPIVGEPEDYVYAARHADLRRWLTKGRHEVTPFWWIKDRASMARDLDRVQKAGFEGLVIRHPQGLYTFGRVRTALKVKRAEPSD